MKQTTAIGIGGAVRRAARSASIMEGGNPMAFINIPALLIVVGGTCVRAARLLEHGGRNAHAEARDPRDQGRHVGRPPGRVQADGRPRREGAPRGPARARGRARGGRRRSSRRRASSWSSTAPTPSRRGDPRSPRSTAWPAATARTPSSSRRSAASRRRSASSAPCWASSTCSRTSRARARSGRSIAGAFLATLYGVGSANLDLPADRQQAQGACPAIEVNYREMILEGVLSIQAGDNPRMLAEKLETLPRRRRERGADEERAGGAAARAGAAGGGMSGARAAEAPARQRRRRRARGRATSAGSSPTPT